MTAEQDSLDIVLVSWTAPPAPPGAGYQVLVTGARTATSNAIGSSHTISVNNQFGVYSIRVRSLSQHLPSETTAPVELTVRGRDNSEIEQCSKFTSA